VRSEVKAEAGLLNSTGEKERRGRPLAMTQTIIYHFLVASQ
jgi:hypothetical protein